MKTYLLTLIAVLALVFSCTTQSKLPASGKQDIAAAKAGDTVRIANDSLEYEVIIIDGGFNYWLQSQARPRNYYSQSYLETKNRQWVAEWNIRAQQPRYINLYQMRIDYEPRINYGYEVNYLIYNYLVYFQITNRQKLGGIIPSP